MALVLSLNKKCPELLISHGGETCRIIIRQEQSRLKVVIDGPLSFDVLRANAKVRTKKPKSE